MQKFSFQTSTFLHFSGLKNTLGVESWKGLSFKNDSSPPLCIIQITPCQTRQWIRKLLTSTTCLFDSPKTYKLRVPI